MTRGGGGRSGSPGRATRSLAAGLSALVVLCLGCASALAPRFGVPLERLARPGRSLSYAPGVDINYEVDGEGERGVVFLHGFASSLRNWDDVRPHLELEGGRLLFVDLKGFGLSARPRDGSYSLADQAAIVTALIEAEGLRRVALVGHSYGGAVALMTVVKLRESGRGDLVERLILLDSAAYGENLPLFIDLLRAPVLRGLTTRLLPPQVQLRTMLKKAFFDDSAVTVELLARYEYFLRLPGSAYALKKAADQAVPDDHRGLVRRYRELELPVFLIWGGRDRIIRPEVGERLSRDLRARRFELLEECGHIPQEEAPRATAALITGFLEGRP